MGLRAARISFAAVTAFCLLAVPATASADQGDKDGGRPAMTQSEANAEAKAGNSENAKAEPKSGGKPAAAPITSPQPKSNADMNPGGANNGGDCGAYCSTRDGSPSQNGKGDGEAKGKPCAGCVGKADNKNPPGQQPNGSDHNAGYECDRNQGIGQSNPAHTGCQPPPAVAPGEVDGCVPTDAVPCEEPDCVATDAVPCETPGCVATEAVPCETAGCVAAETVPCETPDVCVPTDAAPCDTPVVDGTGLGRPVVDGDGDEQPDAGTVPEVLGVRFTRPRANPPAVAGGRLPTTGSTVPVALLLLVGFGLVAAGVGMTVSSPRSG